MDQEHKEALQNATNEEPTEQTLPPRPKVSPCTNLSILISVPSVIIFFLFFLLLFVFEASEGLFVIVSLLTVFCLGIAGISGIIGIISILLSKGNRCGLKRNVLALLLTALGLWFGGTCLLIFSHRMSRIHSNAMRMPSLSNALAMYERDFGCMPKEKWCDLLIQKEDVSKVTFRSFAAKSGECHYAFNKNLIGYDNELPEDVVVLFESKHAGWNQIGGVELMATTEYQTQGSWLYWRLVKALDVEILGKGCFVCFGGGHVEFVKPEEYQTLRWHVP